MHLCGRSVSVSVFLSLSQLLLPYERRRVYELLHEYCSEYLPLDVDTFKRSIQQTPINNAYGNYVLCNDKTLHTCGMSQWKCANASLVRVDECVCVCQHHQQSGMQNCRRNYFFLFFIYFCSRRLEHRRKSFHYFWRESLLCADVTCCLLL